MRTPMKTKILLPLLALAVGTLHADPLLTSWQTVNSGKYARIFTNDGTGALSNWWTSISACTRKWTNGA